VNFTTEEQDLADSTYSKKEIADSNYVVSWNVLGNELGRSVVSCSSGRGVCESLGGSAKGWNPTQAPLIQLHLSLWGKV